MFSVTTNTYILPSTTKTVAKLVHYYNICKKWRCFFEKIRLLFIDLLPYIIIFLLGSRTVGRRDPFIDK